MNGRGFSSGVFMVGRFSRCPHPGLLEIQAVKPGVVRIRGAQSGRFLCLDAGGRPHGEVSGGEPQKWLSFKNSSLKTSPYGPPLPLFPQMQSFNLPPFLTPPNSTTQNIVLIIPIPPFHPQLFCTFPFANPF